MQDFGKFRFYETFKDVFQENVQSQGSRIPNYPFPYLIFESEVVDDVLLCPMETLKVRI
jgi:hypothetical protein